MSLQKYQEEIQTLLFEKYGSFFAYSREQYEKQAKTGTEYVNLCAGMYAPKENAIELMAELEKAYKNAIKQRQNEMSNVDIIWAELANYEAQITMSIDDTWEALQDYPGISKADVEEQYKAYYDHCVENDYF